MFKNSRGGMIANHTGSYWSATSSHGMSDSRRIGFVNAGVQTQVESLIEAGPRSTLFAALLIVGMFALAIVSGR